MSLQKAKEMEVFKGKTLEDILSDVYERSTEDRNEAMKTFREFKDLIDGEEGLFMNGDKPDKYLKIAQESTDNLIKMINAVQKLIDSSDSGDKGMQGSDLLDLLEENGLAPDRFSQRESEKERKEQEDKLEEEPLLPVEKLKVA